MIPEFVLDFSCDKCSKVKLSVIEIEICIRKKKNDLYINHQTHNE